MKGRGPAPAIPGPASAIPGPASAVCRAAAAVFLVVLIALPAAASVDGFTIARLKYGGGGDWYADPSSLPNLLEGLRERTRIRAANEEAQVGILDEELFQYPFLYATGHGVIRLSEAEVQRLRYHLIHGGFLWVDDNYGFDPYFRSEIRRVFPEAEMRELPADHAIYHSYYSMPKGLPKIHEHDGGAPRGYGLFHDGRLVVYYSYNTDIGDGLEDFEVHPNPPEKREEALRMAINIVTYALTH
ncbi:MAG: DUF4159 domain-containing protein [Gemmatimonadetes bacterium]|nr:DUF4159 domain-containing protein [Gemmatimonadota bacterium]